MKTRPKNPIYTDNFNNTCPNCHVDYEKILQEDDSVYQNSGVVSYNKVDTKNNNENKSLMFCSICGACIELVADKNGMRYELRDSEENEKFRQEFEENMKLCVK